MVGQNLISRSQISPEKHLVHLGVVLAPCALPSYARLFTHTIRGP